LLPRLVTDITQIASNSEVNLGDEEDSEAIRGMIRHIYDLPYDQLLDENVIDNSAAFGTNEDLIFHINVLMAADKYDVASLRPLVVKKFEDLMKTNWESESFASSIQRLTGPSAGHLADTTLQVAAATFCAKNLPHLVKNKNFVRMIHEAEPFAGRLLTGFLEDEHKRGKHIPEGAVTIQLKTCKKFACLHAAPSGMSTDRITSYCIMCGISDAQLTMSNQLRESGLVDYKKMYLL